MKDEAIIARFGEFVEFAFTEGHAYGYADGSKFRVALTRPGKLRLTSGKLVISDPEWPLSETLESSAVWAELEPGEYDLEACVLVADRREGPALPPLVGVLRLLVSNNDVDSWFPAAGPPSAPQGFSVSSGMASLLDWDAVPWLLALQATEDELDRVTESLDDGREIVALLDETEASRNMAIFPCPLGDGVYAVWFGRDAAGKVAEIVLDMQMIRWREDNLHAMK